MFRRALMMLLGDYPTVEQWWYAFESKRCRKIAEHKAAISAIRDFKTKQEATRMEELLAECQEQARVGAVLSTTRQVCKIGIDQRTAAVILQRLYFTQSQR